MSTVITPPYEALGPDLILDAVESQGWHCNGRFLALNSYENRVYQIGIEDAPALVAKFYRPERWSDAAILEEHAFAAELVEQEIPVIAPLANAEGQTLHHFQGFRFALFRSAGGRHPELDRDEHLEWVGRYLGRIHGVGRRHQFKHRQRLDVESMAVGSYQFLLEQGFVPPELMLAYRTIAEDVVKSVKFRFEMVGPLRTLRLHGDCHAGNVLWTDDGPAIVDLDDCLTGPVVQDLWMLLAGDRDEMEHQLSVLMRGYEQFFEFDPMELLLVEALRTMRMMHYSAWLARRWHDPAFTTAFPWFNTPRYWEDQILALREQLGALDEPALRLL